MLGHTIPGSRASARLFARKVAGAGNPCWRDRSDFESAGERCFPALTFTRNDKRKRPRRDWEKATGPDPRHSRYLCQRPINTVHTSARRIKLTAAVSDGSRHETQGPRRPDDGIRRPRLVLDIKARPDLRQGNIPMSQAPTSLLSAAMPIKLTGRRSRYTMKLAAPALFSSLTRSCLMPSSTTGTSHGARHG